MSYLRNSVIHIEFNIIAPELIDPPEDLGAMAGFVMALLVISRGALSYRGLVV